MTAAFKRFFHIDSAQRVSGSTSDFIYPIAMQPLPGDDAKGISVVMLGCTIPKSYYLVDTTKGNTFILVENGVNITITVPPGSYDALNFISTVNGLLNAATQNGSVYSAMLSRITAKFT
jgi:hypothetical protein